MMHVLWLDLNSSYSHSNLGFPSLHANLSAEIDAQIEWSKVSGVLNTPASEIILSVVDKAPDVIMATAWLFNHRFLLDILSDIKSLLPRAVVVLGGPEFLGTPAENEFYLRSHPFVNYVFRGDAEESFQGLMQLLITSMEAIGNAVEASAVRGLCFLSPEGQYHDGGVACVEDFHALKYPETSRFFDWSKPFVQLETSRGCFNSCAFCVSGIQSRIQNLPIDTLRQRLDRIVAHGITEVRVLDRTFNAAPARATELMNLFRDYAGKLRFHIEVHPAFLKEKLFQLMDALPQGLLHIEVGVQSLSDRVLTTACRKGSSEAALDGIRRIIANGKFEVHSDLIVGLPEYSYPMLVEDTLRLMGEKVSEIQIETLKCLPGTRMRNEAAEMGLTYSQFPPYEVLKTTWMSYVDIKKAMTLSALVDMWYNSDGTRSFFMDLLERTGPLEEKRAFFEGFIAFCYERGLLDKILSKESRWLELYEYCRRQYPALLPVLAIGWACADLSLKKEPAEPLVLWRYGSEQDNPVFVEGQPAYSYYYVDLPEENGASVRTWVCYDRSVHKVIFVK